MQIALVIFATVVVVGSPVALVWWERASGRVSSIWLGFLIGMLCSLVVSLLGRLVWEALPGHEDLLFSELMVWGYLRRLAAQRRLGSALDMVGPMSEGRPHVEGLSGRERAKLLEELVSGIETSDPYLQGHSRRVARHAWMIAKRMGLSPEEVARIRTAAAIHDVGKIHTPKAILHKPDRLSDEEYDVIKQHPGDGALMAEVLRDEALTSIVRHHHERLDGTGYPDALCGYQIPLGARIIAVADTFDAITSERPYRSASPHKKAISILMGEAGTRLDPDVVHAFCSHYAGRTPIALTWFLTALPERALAWFSGGIGTVATAAKVAAVAAIVGGAALASSTVHPQAPRRHAPARRALARLSDASREHTELALTSTSRHRTLEAVDRRARGGVHKRISAVGTALTLSAPTTSTTTSTTVTPAASTSTPASSPTTAVSTSSVQSSGEAASPGQSTAPPVSVTPPSSGTSGTKGKEPTGGGGTSGGKARERNGNLEAARAAVEQRRGAVAEAKAALAEGHAQLEDLQVALTESRAALQAALARGAEHPRRLEAALARAEEHLARQQQAIAADQERLAALEADLARSEEHLASLEAAAGASQEEVKGGGH